MSTNHTLNYGLCQWEADDQVLRTDFNSDNAKIDAALAGKAPVSALDSLKATVAGKASQSSLDALARTVSQHTTSLAGKGDCMLYTTSYVGTGTYGDGNRSSLTFPKPPAMVYIDGNRDRLIMMRHQATTSTISRQYGLLVVTTTWSGNTLTWYGSDYVAQMNDAGRTYYVFAFLSA